MNIKSEPSSYLFKTNRLMMHDSQLSDNELYTQYISSINNSHIDNLLALQLDGIVDKAIDDGQLNDATCTSNTNTVECVSVNSILHRHNV